MKTIISSLLAAAFVLSVPPPVKAAPKCPCWDKSSVLATCYLTIRAKDPPFTSAELANVKRNDGAWYSPPKYWASRGGNEHLLQCGGGLRKGIMFHLGRWPYPLRGDCSARTITKGGKWVVTARKSWKLKGFNDVQYDACIRVLKSVATEWKKLTKPKSTK
jgi:hypothetical protein